MHKATRTLMVQGTTSDAGKSTLVAAIGRILARHGYGVAPFKPQNMALNSAVTADGGEIGRAQAVQAQACRVEPHVHMNPVLLKPNSDVGAQVIVHGKAIGNQDAQAYHNNKPTLLNAVIESHQWLIENYGAVVVEGAGSPAEVNLRDRDIANMGFAEAVDCPVILIADIDRGGVFAHLIGTLACLSDSEQNRIKGFVINRFRGDISLLEPGLEWLEQKTGKPVLGVIPYLEQFHLEAEDAISVKQQVEGDDVLQVVVPVLPRISNHTDFDPLALHPKINLEFIKDPALFKKADLIILPGSKSVIADLQWLKDSGWEQIIHRHLRFKGKLMGICGGLQMLGMEVHDLEKTESETIFAEGFNFLPIKTELQQSKILKNVDAVLSNTLPNWLSSKIKVNGYEIHTGVTEVFESVNSLWFLEDREDGFISDDDQVFGTYLHGLFESEQFIDAVYRWVLNVNMDENIHFNYKNFREMQIDRLADVVEASIPLDNWLSLFEEKISKNSQITSG